CLARVKKLEDGAIADFECRIRDQRGKWRWFHSWCVVFAREPVDGSVSVIVVMAIETTERKLAEEALRESESILRTVTSEAGVGLMMVNEERRYVFANQTYAQIFGLPHDELAGRSLPEVQREIYGQIGPQLDRAFAGERV